MVVCQTIHRPSTATLLGSPVQFNAIQYNSLTYYVYFEVVVGGGGVLDYSIFEGVYNILSTLFTYTRWQAIRNTFQCNADQYTTTTHYDLRNKHNVELLPF